MAAGMDATTVWVRWDSMPPDGSINPGEMTSFNHCAFDAVADWVYSEAARAWAAEAGEFEIRVRRPSSDIRLVKTLTLVSGWTEPA